ncbi:MAG: Spy/CpxP family protein refolding chaperone [Thermodesulfobacteriota bacterium]
MKKVATTVGIIALAASLAIPVYAYGKGWGKDRGKGIRSEGRQSACMRTMPNLTAEQTDKLTQLRTQRDQQAAPTRNEMIAKRAELRNLWLQANPDEAAIKAKHQEINDLRNKLQSIMTEYRLEAGKVLTPEQRAQLQSPKLGWGYRGHAKRPGPHGYSP